MLDIACGEGYGSSLLATTAKSVQGVDISAETVTHARENYAAPNLTFLEGSAAQIPLPDHSVDLVVSFETIEHHKLHHEMMREIVRVLRPGGMLCISSPDRATNADVLPPNSNPYHVKELYRNEFEDLVSTYFSSHSLYGQRSVMGSLICGAEAGRFSSWNNNTPDHAIDGVAAPKFYIILATNGGSLPVLPTGILESPEATCQDYYELVGRHGEVVTELEAEKVAHTELQGHIASLEDYMAKLKNDISNLEGSNSGLQDDISCLKIDIDCLQSDKKELEKYIAHLRGTIDSLYGEIASMLNSRSWRCTEPLRKATNKLRSLRSRVKSKIWHIRHLAVGSLDSIITGLHSRWNCWHMFSDARLALSALQGEEVSIRAWDLLKGRPELVDYFVNPHETLDRLEAIPDEAKRNAAVEGFQRALSRCGSFFPALTAARLPRVVLISGEPETPGHAYRMARLEKALANDFQVYLYTSAEVGQHQNTIFGADLVWIWRAIHTDTLGELVRKVQANGKRVIFDIDDLCFLPEMATAKFMDAIRSNNYNESEVQMYTRQIQQVMQQVDLCVASTLSLAQKIHEHLGCPCKVLPNCFDRAIHDSSIRAYFNWKEKSPTTLCA